MTNHIDPGEIGNKAYFRFELERIEQLSFQRPLTLEEQAYQGKLNLILLEIEKKERELTEAQREDKSREMKNRRRRGKYGEKRVAKQIGGRVDGRAGKKDVRKGMFYFEVKSLKTTPKFNDNIMSEARSHCPKGQIPVAVIRNTTNRNEYAIIGWQDFIALHGGK